MPPLPDGGLAALLGDGGLMNGLLDAPRDSVIGQIICGKEVKLGAACSSDSPGCVLASLGGVCACVAGIYVCPTSTTAGPLTCPGDAVNGGRCTTPMATCTGAGNRLCLCALSTYVCN